MTATVDEKQLEKSSGVKQDANSTQDGEVVTFLPEEEDLIRRKIDWRLLPPLALLYLISYLDRANMGNAAIIGLKMDLHLTSMQYNLCSSIFFIPYSLFEIPSNLMLKFMKPSTFVTIMMVSWGLVATLQGLVKTFTGLMIARVFLAVCEAGFFPAASYLLTMWYRRSEIQVRASVFYSAGALSGAVSGLLAYFLQLMNGVAGLEGWRRLFILEGIITVLVGCSVKFWLPNSPSSCRFLSDDEKTIATQRLQYDIGTDGGRYNENQPFKWKYVRQAALDYKVWLIVVVYWGCAIPIYA
ncbi:hypothetical protein SEUCBS139899_010741, partial [Sporothrix eucalyptigena]